VRSTPESIPRTSGASIKAVGDYYHPQAHVNDPRPILQQGYTASDGFKGSQSEVARHDLERLIDEVSPGAAITVLMGGSSTTCIAPTRPGDALVGLAGALAAAKTNHSPDPDKPDEKSDAPDREASGPSIRRKM
jgi:hypothetical protein